MLKNGGSLHIMGNGFGNITVGSSVWATNTHMHPMRSTVGVITKGTNLQGIMDRWVCE